MTEEVKILVGSGAIGFVTALIINWFCNKKKIRVKKARLEIEEEITV